MVVAMAASGPAGPVDVLTDRHGIPHIRAGSVEDAFYGQGYVTATHRLWQIDLAHRRGLGRLAAAFGPAFLPYDVAARTVLFQGDLAAEWAALDPRLPGILRAYVAGVNARVAAVRTDRALLPPEFVALGVLPEPWAPEDLLRARFSGGMNAAAELRRARLACAGALAADGLAQILQPPCPLDVPPGLDPCALGPDDLALYEKLSGPLPFGSAVPADTPDPDASDGSNAWVIAPWLSGTGRAVLANDPHLGFAVPGPRFIVHLTAPGFDAIGAGYPGRPGFMFGHNDRIAWGRTNFNIDQEDLVVLRLDATGAQFRGAAGWEPVRRSRERIAVRGQQAVEAGIAWTALGPVIAEAPGRAVVLRAASLLPGPPVALEYPLLALARDWATYRHAIAAAVTGSNYMYADIDGNIGWQAGGRAPRRRRFNGLMPLPGEAGDDWDGLLGLDELPSEVNPARGWIANANQLPFGPDAPAAALHVGHEWVSDDRYRRIAGVLGGARRFGLAESMALQQDTHSMRAAALRPLLERITAPDLAAERALLRDWDGRVEAASPAAALYELWSASLQAAMAHALVPPAARGLVTTVQPRVVQALLLAPDARLGADPVAARDAMLTAALRRASRLRAGRDWGSIHTVALHHPLAARLPGVAADITGLGSGGDGTTVMARWWVSPERPNTTGGAMFAGVLDIGAWDASQVLLGPGQSGDPRSPHYRDLYAPWLAGAYFPLPYSAAAVEAATVERERLLP